MVNVDQFLADHTAALQYVIGYWHHHVRLPVRPSVCLSGCDAVHLSQGRCTWLKVVL